MAISQQLTGIDLEAGPSWGEAVVQEHPVRVDFDDRAELLAAAPDVYYLTDHYLDDSAVLVRLSRVNPDVLRDLLGMAYKFVTANLVLRSPSRKRRNLGFRKR